MHNCKDTPVPLSDNLPRHPTLCENQNRKGWATQSHLKNVACLDYLNGEAYSLAMTLSARNRLEGEVVEIEFGGVMAHVVIRAGKNLIESVITKRSAEEMKLKVGDKVSAVIKSTEVMLEKG